MSRLYWDYRIFSIHTKNHSTTVVVWLNQKQIQENTKKTRTDKALRFVLSIDILYRR